LLRIAATWHLFGDLNKGMDTLAVQARRQGGSASEQTPPKDE
jgi:hypothetical protein